MNFDEVPEFQKDVKLLKRSWRSIPNDIEKAKQVIERLYIPTEGVDMKEFRDQFFGTNRAALLTSSEDHEVVKMRLDCASLGNNKKTRLVFIMIRKADRVQMIELYAKNTNERENIRRIKRHLQ